MAENNSVEKYRRQIYIRQYIRDNRATYTPEIITQKLLEAGYSQMEIDAAFDALVFEDTNKNRRETQPRNDRATLLIVILVMGVVLALVLFGICQVQSI